MNLPLCISNHAFCVKFDLLLWLDQLRSLLIVILFPRDALHLRLDVAVQIVYLSEPSGLMTSSFLMPLSMSTPGRFLSLLQLHALDRRHLHHVLVAAAKKIRITTAPTKRLFSDNPRSDKAVQETLHSQEGIFKFGMKSINTSCVENPSTSIRVV